MNTDIENEVLKKAGALLARRPYSRSELRNKLLKIAGKPYVETTLDFLEQLNLLNDADYAYNFALYRIKRKAWGHAKVRASLLQRQLSRAAIDSALERVRNEVDEESVLADYVERHCGKNGWPTDLKGIRKLVTHLRLRGYEDDIIQRAMKRRVPVMDLRRFETGE